MTRVLFLSERVGAGHESHGGAAHVSATLAGLRERFDVLAVTAEEEEHSVGVARALRYAVPPRVRGMRRDLLFVADDRRFGRRALANAHAFKPDVVYERSEYLATTGLRVSRELGIPLVLEVNGLLERDARTMYRSLLEPAGAAVERIKLGRATHVVTVSTGLRRFLVQHGANPARITVVPNTVDPERVQSQPRPVEPSSATVGFVGHLMPWHRDALERLVDIAPALVESVPDVRFAVLGDGPGLDALERKAADLGLRSRLDFKGRVEHALVPDEVRRFDVGVIPAVFDYAFPVKLVEMGAAGVPVVAPRSRYLDEMIEPGVEYEPFDSRDDRAFTAAVTRLLLDPERRARLGAALHTVVRERYTWSASGDLLAVLIERLAADGR